MSKKISEMPELTTPSGLEEVPLAHNSQWFKIKLANIAKLVTKDSIGLGKVDNTPDTDKPVSKLQQDALDKKANLLHEHAINEVDGLTDALDKKVETTVHTTLVNRVTELETNKSIDIADVTGLTDVLDNKANKTDVPTSAAFTELTEQVLTLGAAIQLVEHAIGNKISPERLTEILLGYVTTEQHEQLLGILAGKADSAAIAQAIQELTEAVQLKVSKDEFLTAIESKASTDSVQELREIVELLVAGGGSVDVTVRFLDPEW